MPIQIAAGQAHETVHVVDWERSEKNDFALAEEVTLKGGYERRPDIVLYLNGLAVGVIELKRSTVEIGDGVRQLITNQEEIFNKEFFSTAQLLFAGSDSQGLRYGTAGTSEQFFVEWKDEAPTATAPDCGSTARPASGPDVQQGAATRFDSELHDLRRRAKEGAAAASVLRREGRAGTCIAKREGGVIWHTQGSGKSIVMVLLAKWILEQDSNARVLVVTDRDELDKQIEGVMKNAGVISPDSASPRVTSRAQFVAKLGSDDAPPPVRVDPQVRRGRPQG